MNKIVTALFLLMSWCCAKAVFPTTNMIPLTWGGTIGVFGGVSNRTQSVSAIAYGADPSGVLNSATSIVAAFAANVGTITNVVTLPSGTYKIATAITLGNGYDNMSLAGDGTNTLFRYTNSGTIALGSQSEYLLQYPTTTNRVVDGMEKGSTNIVVTNVTDFAVGKMLRLSFVNDTNFVFGTGASEFLEGQQVIIRAVSGNTVTIWPPLYRGYPDGMGRANLMQDQLNNFYVRDLVIECTNGTANGIDLSQSYNCYFSNVVVRYAENYHIAMQGFSLFTEMDKVTLLERDAEGSNGALLLHNRSSGTLVYNSCFYGGFPLIEINGSSGVMFAYSFGYDSTVNGNAGNAHGSVGGGAVSVNHGPHNSFLFFEAMLVPNFVSDGYFGSASWLNFLRCWVFGIQPGLENQFQIAMKRMSRWFAWEGNIIGLQNSQQDSWNGTMGEPNISNNDFHGVASPSTGDYWTNFFIRATGVITNRTDDDTTEIQILDPTCLSGITDNWWPISVGQPAGVYPAEFLVGYMGVYAIQMTLTNMNLSSGNLKLENHNQGQALFPANGTQVTLFFGNGGYQELDLDVSNTVHHVDNYLFDTGIDQNVGTPIDSFYLASKPSFLPSNYAWPSFNPDAVQTDMNLTNYVLLPAQFRWLNGYWPTESDAVTLVTNAPPRFRGFRFR